MNKITVKIRPANPEKGMDMSPAEERQIESFNGDCIGEAFDEEGNLLASHYCSSFGWAKHDMGLASNSKHDLHKSRYPGGY